MIQLNQIFKSEKPIIGMIHLAGNTRKEKIKRALEELTIYEEEGIDGAIIEDYHGSKEDVIATLYETQKGFNIVRGTNILVNPYEGFRHVNETGAKFIQFDSIQTPDLNLELYNQLRRRYPNIAVLGGVEFKYIRPTGNPLEQDLAEAMPRGEAIVTTGEGTGIETPIEKLKTYKSLLKDFPLIIGAGVDLDNIYEQLRIADGAIIGSYFKPKKDTIKPIERKKVRELIVIARS
jgi:uncharacterized protein